MLCRETPRYRAELSSGAHGPGDLPYAYLDVRLQRGLVVPADEQNTLSPKQPWRVEEKLANGLPASLPSLPVIACSEARLLQPGRGRLYTKLAPACPLNRLARRT